MTKAVDDLPAEFVKNRELYEAFTNSLRTLLDALMSLHGIEYFSIESRTKEVSSLTEKINREDKAGKYENLSQVTDLSGIRIIAYLQEDCDRVCSLLENILEIDKENSSKKEDELDPDKFGYLSTHYVVSIPENRLSLEEYSRFSGLKCEIQVRTLLQHTWAAIDWKFRYKEERQSPKALRRRLFRISALLEAADNEFSAVRTEISALADEYKSRITQSDLSIDINTESLRSYLTSSVVQSVLTRASEAGIAVNESIGGQAVLAKLSITCHILLIKTLQELETAILDVESEVTKFFDFIIKHRNPRPKNDSNNLYPSAVIRYALLMKASNSQLLTALRESPVAIGYATPIKAYTKMKASDQLKVANPT